MLTRLLVLLASLAIASPSWATMTCTTTDFFPDENGGSDPATVTETIPNNSNQVTVLLIHDRTEAQADPAVTDNQSGTWVKRDGPLDSTNTTSRMWLYERTAGTKGNSTTVTVDWSTAIGWVLVVGTCVSDSANPLTYVSSAAMADHSSTTAWASNSRTFSNPGVLIGYVSSNNNNTMTPGTNQNVMNTGLLRSHIITRAESSGTYSMDATMNGAISGTWGVSLYEETPSGAAVNFFPRRLQEEP